MQPSLTWAIWALFIPLSVAERVARQVNWVDLMTATSKFPRFFGEPAEVNRTGPPQVVALTNATDGRTERMKCSRSTSKAFDCVFDFESCMPSIKKDVLGVIELLQEGHQAAWNNLTFIADRWTRHSEWIDKEEQPFQTVFFNQTNLGGEIEIDNTMNRLVKPLKWDKATSKEGSEYLVYQGEFDNGSPEPSCDRHQARDSAEINALKQPLWDALYPAKEYKLVYTVQDGQLYLTWRVVFDLKAQVADDFIVWVNARNCTQIVAAASAKMDLYTPDLEHYRDQLVELIKERELPVIKDPAPYTPRSSAPSSTPTSKPTSKPAL